MAPLSTIKESVVYISIVTHANGGPRSWCLRMLDMVDQPPFDMSSRAKKVKSLSGKLKVILKIV